MSIYLRFEQAAKRHKSKTAIAFSNYTFSYQQLLVAVNRLASELKSQYSQTNPVVLTVLPNGLEQTVLMLAISKLGWTWLPLAPEQPKEQITHFLNHFEHPILISSREKVSQFNYSQEREIQQTCFLSSNEMVTDFIGHSVLLNFDEWETSEVLDVKVDLNAPFILTMSSGTTGTPKLIAFSQQTKLNRADSAIYEYGLTSDDVIYAGTPQHHSLAQRLTFLPLMLGGTLILEHGFSASKWVELVEAHQVTFTIAVSSQLMAIKQVLSQTPFSNCSLKTVVSSSATMEAEHKKALMSLLNCNVHECYGASEIGTATDILVNKDIEKYTSVGKPLQDVDIKILDPEGNALPPGSIGEIAVKSPLRFLGYYQNVDKTNKSFSSDYFLTGDLGEFDKEGFLYFKGRKKELIISGGINIFPEDIEKVVNEYPYIIESIAFAKPHPYLGEVVNVVFSATEAIDIKALKAHCRQFLAIYQLPLAYTQEESLRKTATGKLKRISYQ